MKTTNEIKARVYDKYALYIKYLIAAFIILLISFMLLRFPEVAGQGISDGIDLCLGTLIPSLYPFMIVSSLITNFNLTKVLEKLFAPICKFFFALPGKCFGVIVLSLIGGYPIGGKMTKEMYENAEISLSQGRRLLLFCVCPGPAFAISSVGFYMLGSKKIGGIIYISLIISALIVGILSRFVFEDDGIYYTGGVNLNSDKKLSSALVKSISSGSEAMLSVCAWVIAFSCISRLVEISPLSDNFKFSLYCILEVTNACFISRGILPIPIIAGLIAFGGLCTHFQIMPSVNTLKLKYKYFITSRILCGGLTVIICNIILSFFPVSYDAFSNGTLPKFAASSYGTSVSIGMLVMCGLFLLGDSLYIKIKAKV